MLIDMKFYKKKVRKIMVCAYSRDEKISCSDSKPANCFVIPKKENSDYVVKSSDLKLIQRLANKEVVKGYAWDDGSEPKEIGYLFSVHFDYEGKVTYEVFDEEPEKSMSELQVSFTYDNFEELHLKT